jgi:hypothetical protein
MSYGQAPTKERDEVIDMFSQISEDEIAFYNSERFTGLNGLGELGGWWSKFKKKVKRKLKPPKKLRRFLKKHGKKLLVGAAALTAAAIGGPAVVGVLGKYGKKLLGKGVSKGGVKKLLDLKAQKIALKQKMSHAIIGDKAKLLSLAQQKKAKKVTPAKANTIKAKIQAALLKKTLAYKAKKAAIDKQEKIVAKEEVKRPTVRKRAKIAARQKEIATSQTKTPPGYRSVLVPSGASVRIEAAPSASTVAKNYPGTLAVKGHQKLVG